VIISAGEKRGLTGPADAASTMDRSDAAPLFIVSEHLKNVPHVLNRFGQGPIDYRESVVFDVGKAHVLGANSEIGSVSTQFINLGQVYERSDASCEQRFYLLFRDAWTPRVFTCEEERSSPVRVWDGTSEDCVYGGVKLLLGEQNIDAVLTSWESGARQGSGHG